MAVDNKSRAREFAIGLKSFDLANYNLEITGALSAYDSFVGMTAFENLTDNKYYVAVIEEWSKNALELAIHPFPASSYLSQQGYMAYNLGTSLTATDAVGALADTIYSLTDATPGIGYTFILSIYAEAAFTMVLTNLTAMRNNVVGNEVLPAGQYTFMMRTIADDQSSIEILQDGEIVAPAGLAVKGFAITKWSQNQARAIK